MYGVNDSQMEAISFGKEKPKALGHDEATHAQNRRADMAYLEACQVAQASTPKARMGEMAPNRVLGRIHT